MIDICIATNPAGLPVAAVALILATLVAVVRAVRMGAGRADEAPSIWSVNTLLFFAGGVLAATSLACIPL